MKGPNLFHAAYAYPGMARMAGCCSSVNFYFWGIRFHLISSPSPPRPMEIAETKRILPLSSYTTYTSNKNPQFQFHLPKQRHQGCFRLGVISQEFDGGNGVEARRPDKAPAGGEGAGPQGGGRAAGEGQGDEEDVPVGEQHHHAPPSLQGRPQGHQGRLRPLRRGLQRDDRQRGAAELPEQARGADVGEGGRRRAPLLRRRQQEGDPVPGVRRPPLPHVPALRPQRHTPGFRVRVGQAQLHLRRAHRRLPLLQQGRRRQGDQERRYPEDERGVSPGEDANPHNHTAIQGDGPEQ